MTLIDRLTAAIEERAAKARAAAAGPWQVANAIEIVGPRASGRIGADDAIVSCGDSGGGVIDTPTAEHIAHNDPATVLRMCDAHRALVEIAFGYAAKIDGEWGCCHSAEDIRAGLCDRERPDEQLIILTLARAYGLTEEDT